MTVSLSYDGVAVQTSRCESHGLDINSVSFCLLGNWIRKYYGLNPAFLLPVLTVAAALVGNRVFEAD